MKKNIVTITIIGVLMAAAGFGGGYFYAQMNHGGAGGQNARFNSMGGGQNNFGGGAQNIQNRTGNMMRQGGGGIFGEILKIDEQSLTIKLPNNSSQIVFYSDKTKLSKSVDAAKEDLQVGKTISVQGKAGSDGSLAADTIQLRNPTEIPDMPGANTPATAPVTAIK
ncbi:hypothetical protein IT411_03795 [Candidatus Peregrinibacteria bacterium]|nr:hypothetical protein [Candidatus Peregrinibacteria bacterium]